MYVTVKTQTPIEAFLLVNLSYGMKGTCSELFGQKKKNYDN